MFRVFPLCCYLVVSTCTINCLERLVFEMTCYVSSRMFNHTHSLTHSIMLPSVNSNFASRAFSVSVPSVWNSLKPNLRSIDSAASFKSQLKTTLFLSAYGSTIQSLPALLIRFILSTKALYKFLLYCIVLIISNSMFVYVRALKAEQSTNTFAQYIQFTNDQCTCRNNKKLYMYVSTLCCRLDSFCIFQKWLCECTMNAARLQMNQKLCSDFHTRIS